MELTRETIGPLAPEVVRAIVEIPAGRRERYEYRKEMNRFEVDYLMDQPAPANYGWIPETLADDGEMADIAVLGPSLQPGTVVEVRPVGLFWRADGDHKVVAVPAEDGTDPGEDWGHVRDLADLNSEWREKVARFLRTSPQDAWQNAAAACAFIQTSWQRSRNVQGRNIP